jgi:hypothetical protein
MISAENEFLINVATLFLAYQRPAAEKARTPVHFAQQTMHVLKQIPVVTIYYPCVNLRNNSVARRLVYSGTILSFLKLSMTEFRIVRLDIPTADSVGASSGLDEVFERKE